MRSRVLSLYFRVAKEKKLRLWKNYQPSASALPVAEKSFVAKVCQRVNDLKSFVIRAQSIKDHRQRIPNKLLENDI